MKYRVIPTLLTDGENIVKGEKFDNWRTIGNAEAISKVFGKRDVDELLLLDVTARLRKVPISAKLMSFFTNSLNVPFSVGGGINSLLDAKNCFRAGAEKVVLGTAAFQNQYLISEIADLFGTQAIIVSLDFKEVHSDLLMTNSGKIQSDEVFEEIVQVLEKKGAGEFLVQSCEMDGTMKGMDINKIEKVRKLTKLPIIASGGVGSMEDFITAINSGASAVAAGALFQFTEITPRQVGSFLGSQGISIRNR
jgi:cyclase